MDMLTPDMMQINIEFPRVSQNIFVTMATLLYEYICVIILTSVLFIFVMLVQKKITCWFPVVDRRILEYAIRIRDDFFTTPLPSEDEVI